MKILKMAQSDGVGLAEVAKVAQGDPALTGRILKLVNSAYYAGARTITAISDAVARLGLRVVWEVTLGFSVISTYRKGKCRNFDYDHFWSHSLATAVAAQLIARQTRLSQPEEAFTCGLLSQIGRLALACIYPDTYANLLAGTASRPDSDQLKLEQEAFATDNRELTAAMLQDWGLPEVWVQAVRWHDDPLHSDLEESEAAYKLSLLMNAASLLGSICIAENSTRSSLLEQLVERSASLGVSKEALWPICDLSVREWVAWGSALSVKTQQLPPFVTIADESQQAECQEDQAHPCKPQDPSETRVLIVDEDLSTAELASEMLPSGSQVATARSGEEAVLLALEFDPQLIITDWAAPGLSGVEFCRALRKTKAGQHVYILILAHEYNEDVLAAALEAGANEYIMKPIHPRILEARIKVAQRVIRLQQEVFKDREEIREHLAELAVLNRTLEQAALTDPLTGLPNRRYALDRLAEEWAASMRSKAPLSCMIVDLDHFKRVNDTYGHDAGDQVLREVAAVLRKSLRATDVVCRIGGEEFLIICRETDGIRARGCAERLRQRVEEHRTVAGSLEIPMTISIGIAFRTHDTPNVAALLKRADLATYASKTAGRNRVSIYEPA